MRHDMREQKAKAHVKEKIWDNTLPLSCHPHPDMNQPPPTYSIPPSFIITIQWTQFLVQMRQSNKCGKVRNDEISTYTWDLVRALESASRFLQDTSHIYWFHLPKQLTRKKPNKPEMRFNSQQIVPYCLGLCTQNPGLREIDLESRPKWGSDKINMLK